MSLVINCVEHRFHYLSSRQTKDPPFVPSHMAFTRAAFFAVGVTVATANIDAIAVTDYELGYCTSLSPTGTPPSPPGYWCSSFNRGVVEKACWLATQNCCYLDMNKTVAPYPGTGQCVHTDPCADSGGKLCGLTCHPLRTTLGLMQCIRPEGGDAYPLYTKQMCIGKTSTTSQQFGDFLGWACNPANSNVNCDMINSGGAYAHDVPGLFPSTSPSDAGTYQKGSWALNQLYLLTGECNGMGELVDVPSSGPTPPTPKPTPTPTATPGPTALPGVGKMLWGVCDCSVPSFNVAASCASAVKVYSNGKLAVGTVPMGWADPSKLDAFFGNITALYNGGLVPLISWLPYPYKTWTNPSPNVDIANGLYDDYITAFFGKLQGYIAGEDGRIATADDRRVYIRFAPEANGDYFPWSPTCPSCSSTGQNISQSMDSYIQMWAKVRAMGNLVSGVNNASSVQWLWVANNEDAPDGSSTAAGVYPGEHADWVGVDGLNFGSTIPGHTWQSAEQLLAAQYTVVRNLAPTKPVAITTLGSTSINGVGMKGSWLSDAMIYLKSLTANGLGMALFLNQDTSTDFAFMGGTKGTATSVVGSTTVNVYTALSTSLDAATWLTLTSNTTGRLLTDEQFLTGA